MPDTPDDQPVESALEALRDAIARRIRAEQLRDQLTGLANDSALEEWLGEQVESGSHFWIAFVEVDYFKRINDGFGYANGDLFLSRVAEQLLHAARSHLATTVPYRAHGDEFFLAGALRSARDADAIGEVLEHVRKGVDLVRIEVPEKTLCRGTVSVGWLTSHDSRRSQQELTPRFVRAQLEAAVALAKRTRNTVVRFDPDVAVDAAVDARVDCSKCHAKFTYQVPKSSHGSADLWCPNCGLQIPRP